MVPSFKHVSKWAYRLTKQEKISWAMRRAFTVSQSGRPGPVFLEIPMYVGNEEYVSQKYRTVPIRKSRPDEKDVLEALLLIARSERPVIVAGGGVILAQAFKEILDFAESLAIPILTTPSGRGTIPENHPLAAGMVGLYRTRVSKRVYEESDLVISVGSKNEEFQTAGWNYFPAKAKFVQLDVEPSEVGRNFVPDVALIGDAKLALRDLVRATTELMRRNKMRSDRLRRMLKAKREYEEMVGESARPGRDQSGRNEWSGS
jgi:thiamine pyrophosphate-dependent acetolactate synthase large subunit-like protein